MNLAEIKIKDSDNSKEFENGSDKLYYLNIKGNEDEADDNEVPKTKVRKNYFSILLYILALIIIILFICYSKIYSENADIKDKFKIIQINKDINKENETESKDGTNEKIGIAFIYHIMHSNGVARVISLLADHLVKTGRYNVYIISGKENKKDYKYDNRIQRFLGHDNKAKLKELKEKLNIQFFILNNQLTKDLIQFLQSLKTKVIGIFHGVYLSPIFHNNTQGYRSWYKYNYYNAFITVSADDLYVYKKLGYKMATFLPNLYTFEPLKTPESNLTYNNIVILGRAHDKIKGAIYAIEAMSYIVKEVPDANLIFATSDYNINNLKKLAKNYGISKNIIFKIFPNITEVFLNSSVLMFTSLCEAFPMAMNEGKAFGLPVVAFNIPFSPPFQSGVITVPHLDTKALAKETVKLLKDYNYRRIKGKDAKLSLNRFSNKETTTLWEKLFKSLSKGNKEYSKFQKEIEKKYYDEKSAREHVLMHFNSALNYNKYFRCHKFEDMLKMDYIKNIKNCTKIT